MTISLATTSREIEEIRDLQEVNLKGNIRKKNRLSEGFLTAKYEHDFLKAMNDLTPAIIAKQNGVVVGYALATDRSLLTQHPLLNDLGAQINKIPFGGKFIGDFDYLVVGQLCVAKEVRGRGLAQDLYAQFKATYESRYPFAITDVDRENLASLKAHLKVGFQVVSMLQYGGSNWHVIIWDWRTH
ncbi:MAG: GNAT family N-acetyltransferase [Flavobacteriaceae bacterium]|nr:GNAT family N-acetyltransferase [Flavobacteriaceae bacterium]